MMGEDVAENRSELKEIGKEGVELMAEEAQQKYKMSLEHAITTVMACLGMIKYNVVPGEEQRETLVADIKTTLQFLRGELTGNTSIEAQVAILPSPQTGLVTAEHLKGGVEDHKEDQYLLRALYKVYRAYLNMGQENAPDTFVARFSEAMTTLDEIQEIVEQVGDAQKRHDISYGDQRSVEDPLHRVRGFIADLYYIFMEFMHALSSVLNENDVRVDTEEISSMQRYLAESTEEYRWDDKKRLAPLISVYEMHQRVYMRRGAMARQVSDAIAFLEFLEESLGSDFDRRDEMVAQLVKVAKLLSDLSHLLANYENAAAALLGLPG